MATKTTNQATTGLPAAETSRVKQQMVEVVAAVRMAGEEPSSEAIEASRAVLSGEMSGDEALAIAYAAIDKRYGVTRAPQR